MTELFRAFLADFYRLSYFDIFLLLSVFSWGYLSVLERRLAYSSGRLLSAALPLLWMGILLYTTLGSRDAGGGSVNLVPFHTYMEVRNGGNPEIYRSNFMNVVLFFPGGFFLGCSLPERRSPFLKLLLSILLFCAFSAGIEYLQYTHSLGRTEIDDVIHNTLGALLGSLVPGLRQLCKSHK